MNGRTPAEAARRYLRDLIFGAVDGTVTTFAIVAGAVGADLGGGVVMVLGLANLVADGFSMAVSNYLGTRAEYEQRSPPADGEDGPPPPHAAALATFIAFTATGSLPLLPFALDAMWDGLVPNPFPISAVLTGFTFLGIGIAKAKTTGSAVVVSAAETLALGGGAALVAYGIGWGLRGLASS